MKHGRCGCVEKFHGLDCPACHSTGICPPISYEEFLKMMECVRRLHDLEKGIEKFPFTISQRKLLAKYLGSSALDIILTMGA